MLNDAATNHGFSRATVVGAGLMGRRIAGVLAGGGLAVTLYDANAAVLDEARLEAETLAGRRGSNPGAVETVTDLAQAVADSDLVVEAVVEDLGVKQQLFAELADLTSDAVLATNTSVLPVTAIANRVIDGGRVVGTHWWNPPDLIPIVEVVAGERTDAAVVDRLVALLEHLGKQPVRVNVDVPGFIGNRLQHALWREALALVSEGVADAETVDLVVRNTIGLRLAQMGPIENADYVGLDLTRAIHEAVLPSLSIAATPDVLLLELLERGDLGAKSGRGYLAWPPGRREQVAARLSAHVSAQLTDTSTATPSTAPPTTKEFA